MKDTNAIVIAKLTFCMLALVWGCGESPTSSAQGFLSAIYEKECEQWLRCEEGDEEELFERAEYTLAQCKREEVLEGERDLEAFVAARTVRYDASAAKVCLDSFDELCIGGRVDACDQVFTGTVGHGGPCSDDIECISGLCNANSVSCGQCVPIAALGSSCANGEDCGYDAYCDTVAGSICVAFDDVNPVAYAQAELGESCADTATLAVRCAPGLVCNDETERCSERFEAGVRCEDDDCAPGTLCLFRASADAYRCAPVETTDVLGADCGDLETRYVVCDRARRLYCGDGGTCLRLGGDGSNGSDCLLHQDCKSGRCEDDYPLGVCVAGDLPNGASCTDDAQCESRFCTLAGGPRMCADVTVCFFR